MIVPASLHNPAWMELLGLYLYGIMQHIAELPGLAQVLEAD